MPRFSPDFLDELRARLRASDVIGRHLKLKKEGREYRGLSPFTSEKTPSFFVNDEKGRFFDFSSGKSGDIVGFLMETQNLSFPEAVSQLADLAGMEIPKDTPDDERREKVAKDIAGANVEAAKFYRAMLTRAEGREALAYLDRRGVSERARQVFGLGYAPGTRTALLDHLINHDFPLDLLVEAGLVIRPDDGGKPYDKFRDRVMFPILGRRGVIAFGGRALSKDVQAKYMNSPETPLFHKSATLYHYDRARKMQAETKKPLLVAEGYMDVIALWEAGLPAVAPLGTAITERQLEMLWRATDTPVMCLDGDRAGQAAAFRAIDRALPILKPGKSLNFAFLPEGQDPDDLIRAKGASAMEEIIEAARPMADVLWEHESETHPRTTPEQAAAFRRQLREKVKDIADPDVKHAYGDYFAVKLNELQGSGGGHADKRTFRGTGRSEWRGRPKGYSRGPMGSGFYRDQVMPSTALKSAMSAAKSAETATEAVLVLALANHPGLIAEHEDEVFTLEIADPGLSRVLGRILDAFTANPDLDSGAVASHLSGDEIALQTYSDWMADPRLSLLKFIKPGATAEFAEQGWLNALSKYRYHGDLEAEVADAAISAHQDAGQEKIWREAVSHRSRLVSEHKPDESQD
ncbi:DNA primase [Parvularcula marina]|uniref:DNA primase n=1 Tax=Parvularcula marina TaxID=2292771 RepID=A0A371REK5_9PROT|nr:DNA primase [Parvularcula marina]RFB03874.1 DNA primase [Parvularcula marina]